MENKQITDIEKAKAYLKENNYTMVLCKENHIFSSHKRGVAPLLELCDFGLSFDGYSAADKVVGKGAALLYAYLKVSKVYAVTISKIALNTLIDKNIEVEYDTVVDRIKDRNNKGFCPIESIVENCDNENEALQLIKEKVKEF